MVGLYVMTCGLDLTDMHLPSILCFYKRVCISVRIDRTRSICVCMCLHVYLYVCIYKQR